MAKDSRLGTSFPWTVDAVVAPDMEVDRAVEMGAKAFSVGPLQVHGDGVGLILGDDGLKGEHHVAGGIRGVQMLFFKIDVDPIPC